MVIPEPIEGRRSVRAFTSRDVSDEEVGALIRAATLAPSAGNRQPWGFVAVRDEGVKDRLVDAAHGQGFIGTAPVVIVVCADPGRSASRYGERGSRLYCLQDTAAAIQNILLTATANGLGTCWVGAFDEGRAAETIGAPEGIRPVAIIPVGHPAERPPQRPRRSLDEVTHFDKW